MRLHIRPASLTAITGSAISSAVAYPFLPKLIPTKFDADGNVTSTSSRAAATLGPPVGIAALWLLYKLFGAWPGGNDWEDRAAATQAREEGVATLMWTVTAIHALLLGRAAGLPIDMARADRVIVGGSTLVLGNIMPRWPRSMIGIRTPWTLADPAVWERTHRFGGYLFTGVGLLSLASLVSTRPLARRLPYAALAAAVATASAYSFVEWTRLRR